METNVADAAGEDDTGGITDSTPDSGDPREPDTGTQERSGLVAMIDESGITVNHYGVMAPCEMETFQFSATVSDFLIDIDYGFEWTETGCPYDFNFTIDPQGVGLYPGLYTLRALTDQIVIDLSELLH